MKTMDCLTLETLIENHEPVDLIDIRPKNEFREMHIPGARSLPLAELSPIEFFTQGDLRHHGDQDRTPCGKDDIANCIRYGVAEGREFALCFFLNGAKRSGDCPCAGTST